MKTTFLTICICLFFIVSHSQIKPTATFTNTERKAIVKALHEMNKDQPAIKYIVRPKIRQGIWATVLVTPTEPGTENNYETMLYLVKQTGKTWNILEQQDDSTFEEGGMAFFKICRKK